MTAPFTPVKSGEPISISASNWNSAMEATKRVLGGDAKQSYRPAPRSSHHTLQVQNATDKPWPNRACVQIKRLVWPSEEFTGIGGPSKGTNTAGDYSKKFLGWLLSNPLYSGQKPEIRDQSDWPLEDAVSEKHATLFSNSDDYTRCGITLQPAAPNEVVPVLFSGITQVRMQWDSTKDEALYLPESDYPDEDNYPNPGNTTRDRLFGLPIDGEVEFLQRSVGGFCRIMMPHHIPDQTGVDGIVWCTVMLDAAEARMCPIIEFKLTEDFTVNDNRANAKVVRSWGHGIAFKHDKDVIVSNPQQHNNESISSQDEGEHLFRGIEGHMGIAYYDEFRRDIGPGVSDHNKDCFLIIMMECP